MVADELDSIITVIISDASYSPDYRIIIDTSQTKSAPRSGEVVKIAELFKGHQDVFCSKTAIIVKSGLYREVMGLVLVFIKAKTEIQIELFSNIGAAMEWLDEEPLQT